MKNLEYYFEDPYDNLEVGKDKVVEFYDHHRNSLINQVALGAPFAGLVDPTNSAVENLKESLSSTTTNIALQKAKTLTVDDYIELFVGKAKEFEVNVRVFFKKTTPTYLEFYPQGMKPFNNVNKGSINKLMVQVVSAFKTHQDVLGAEFYDELNQIYTDFNVARDLQEQKMNDTKSTRSSWDDRLEVMKQQAFKNLLLIAIEYRGKPEKAKLFFDQSILHARHHKTDSESDAYILTVPKNSIATADMSFSVDDTLLLYNSGTVSLFYYGAATPDAPQPLSAIEILPDEEKEVTAASLGAPTNKYLLFANNDATDGEVEISILA